MITPLEDIQKVRLLRRGRGVLEKRTKTNKGRGVLACVYVRFFKKKMLRFSKWSFIVILQFFLLIIMVIWNIKRTIMKDCDIQFCQWMACDRFRQSTQDHNVGYVKNIYLQPLVVGWISIKGCGKVQYEQSFFWRQFRSVLVFPINLDLESHGR